MNEGWSGILTLIVVVVVLVAAAQDDAPSIDELSCARSRSISWRAVSYSAGVGRCWRTNSLPVARLL